VVATDERKNNRSQAVLHPKRPEAMARSLAAASTSAVSRPERPSLDAIEKDAAPDPLSIIDAV
jgi:hypothetical protein